MSTPVVATSLAINPKIPIGDSLIITAAPQLGLPVEGVALIFAVDFFVNAGRTMINVLGQILTVSVIEKTEGYSLEEDKQHQLSVNFS